MKPYRLRLDQAARVAVEVEIIFIGDEVIEMHKSPINQMATKSGSISLTGCTISVQPQLELFRLMRIKPGHTMGSGATI